MKIKELSITEAEDIYKRYLLSDFPFNEVKPFTFIRRSMEKNRYRVYAAFTGRLSGYAFLATSQKDGAVIGLLDYYAICADQRGQGLGSQFLQELFRQLDGFSCILIEADSVTEDLTAAEKEKRRRRIRFYQKCGVKKTGVKTVLYGVDYDILIWSRDDRTEDQTVCSLIDYMYHEMYPASWFKELIRITLLS